ncbi:TIM-barrel domain-containing protein [Aureibaculum conchae]|uniref:TIM-barrel domain-containing protein n=1 Tax=Aureibaculum sp. 2308TA14-22 TaxID=3108392 RepID=UPI0033967943
MNFNIIKYLFLSIICLSFFNLSCKAQKEKKAIYIGDDNHVIKINPSTFQFQFENTNGDILASAVDSSGLLINGYPIISSFIIDRNKSENVVLFDVANSKGETAKVTVSFKAGIAKFTVKPNTNLDTNISLRLGGMPVAHGLGDAGAFRESFNLLENKNKSYNIINDGGGQRWASSFVVFPKNNLAGVFFDRGEKNVTLDEKEYTMNISKTGAASFYYFIGDLKSIYKNYKQVREEKGYADVKPKSRLFELGWESWDALGWNTNQKTVQEILQHFRDNDYPIKWAVTGSGFWDQGGTTTSFGRWGKKFPKPKLLKDWMHANDMKWMIGLRTNFIPEGGPYFPKTKKRDKNLKVDSFYGNELTTEAKKNKFLVLDSRGDIVEKTSRVFPIVPSNLLDGDMPGAAKWYQQQYAKWGIDGIKEDTMMQLDSLTGIFNKPIVEIADKGGWVMARNGEFTAPGTLLRINDTGVNDITKRIPISYMQYAASGFPNVYSDVAGVHNMHNVNDVDRNIRHTWLLSLTAGIAVGAYPKNWPKEKKALFKKAIDVHYKLTPYMYSAALEGYHSGFPTTLTPLTIAYPDVTNVASIPNYQWMIGESILATPLLKNHKSGKMDVYLPKGVWFDYETGEKYEGNQTLKGFEIPLDKTPIFIGGKGVIVERTADGKPLKAKVYPVSNTSVTYTFTYPDGESISTITNNGSWASKDKLKVKDITENKDVAFDYEVVSGYASFEIKPNHNYKIGK